MKDNLFDRGIVQDDSRFCINVVVVLKNRFRIHFIYFVVFHKVWDISWNSLDVLSALSNDTIFYVNKYCGIHVR
jgi:hypothetical protein